MANNRPYLPNMEPYIAAGLDPKTGLPYRMGRSDEAIKRDVAQLIKIVDRQDAVNRYTWYNLPKGLTSQLMERILYFKGQAAFFMMNDPEMPRFYFLPYALDGTIDIYGRYTDITPLPFANGKSDDGRNAPWIQGLKKHCVYDVVGLDELDLDVYKNSAVLLWDYSPLQGQTITPRFLLNDAIVNVEADCIPFMRTALLNGTGIQGMRVNSEDESAQVFLASKSLNNAALTGQKFVPIVGMSEFQDLTGGNLAKAEEYMMAQESLDNFRLALLGITNGGLFQKKAHMLQAEQNAAGGGVSSVLQDGLTLRQNFCNIVNSIWGIGIWCDVSDALTMQDNDMDGQAYDQYDQSGTDKAEPVGGDDNGME